MASPLAQGLFARAVGESTAQMDPAAGILGRQTFAEAEQAGVQFMHAAGAESLAALRKMPAEAILKVPGLSWITERDHYVLPNGVYDALAAGSGRDIDLIVGSNAKEGANLRVPWVKPRPDEAEAYTRLYPRQGDPDAYTDVVLWQMNTWARLHAKAGGRTYQFWFTQAPPLPPGVRYAEGKSGSSAPSMAARSSMSSARFPCATGSGPVPTARRPTSSARIGRTSCARAIPTVRGFRAGRGSIPTISG